MLDLQRVLYPQRVIRANGFFINAQSTWPYVGALGGLRASVDRVGVYRDADVLKSAALVLG